MGLRRNIFASSASQAYVAGVGIVALPFYLRLLGAEAYGLAGFFAMLQAWFLLLDIGLTPTMARETARFRGHGTYTVTLKARDKSGLTSLPAKRTFSR